jgi:hypothetical protein
MQLLPQLHTAFCLETMRMTPKQWAKVPIYRKSILAVKLLLFILDLGLCSNHVMSVLNLQGSLRDTQAGLPTNH